MTTLKKNWYKEYLDEKRTKAQMIRNLKQTFHEHNAFTDIKAWFDKLGII